MEHLDSCKECLDEASINSLFEGLSERKWRDGIKTVLKNVSDVLLIMISIYEKSNMCKKRKKQIPLCFLNCKNHDRNMMFEMGLPASVGQRKMIPTMMPQIRSWMTSLRTPFPRPCPLLRHFH